MYLCQLTEYHNKKKGNPGFRGGYFLNVKAWNKANFWVSFQGLANKDILLSHDELSSARPINICTDHLFPIYLSSAILAYFQHHLFMTQSPSRMPTLPVLQPEHPKEAG